MEDSSIFQMLLATISAGSLSAYWSLYALTGIACAYYVYKDAKKQGCLALNIRPCWWAVFSLIGGVWALVAYWLLQHSTLRKFEE